jgi:CRISPR/Cas system CSM-associated protein Csm3 (group 7 of RAMP superfamily)
VEDDYLGGQGSRGSGKVEFHNLSVQLRRGENYEAVPELAKPFKDLTLPALIERKDELLAWVKNNLPQS